MIRCFLRMFLATLALLAGCAASTATAQGLQPTQADAHFYNYKFENGETLDDLRIRYATLGSARRSEDGTINNAVLVLHWTGASSKAVLTPKFIDALYGPGKPLDAQRYYLIFPDSIGGGGSSKPSDGLRARFPHYGYNDMVEIQHRLVREKLGIGKLHAILGISMGGMNAWQWAVRYPDEVGAVMPVVAFPSKLAGRNAIWRQIAVNLIEQDPAYLGGEYTAQFRGFKHAFGLLSMMIEGVQYLQTTAPDWKGAGSFLEDVASRSVGADPNDFLYSLKASADYNPEPQLEKIKARVFALNFGDDEFNPDELGVLQRLVPKIPGGRYVVQAGSDASHGHWTMTLPELWAHHVGAFMGEIGRK